MKQLLALTALLGTALLTTACGGSDTAPAQAAAPTEATAPAQVTEPGLADEAADAGIYTVGVIEGNHFVSPWLNLRFESPEGFIMATQEEMLELMAVGLELSDIDPATANWLDMALVNEMMAMLPTGSAQVSLVTERLMLSGMTMEQYIEAAFAGVESLLGWGVEFHDDLRTIEFAGLEWYTYTATIDAFGMDWSYQYLARRFGDRMALITIYALAGQEAYMDALFAGFSAY